MHRTIAILGGMSPESTVTYYELITRGYTERFGDYGYPEILIHSVNFQKYVDWQHQGRWDLAAEAMADALNRLRRAGADFGLIATNTMHIVFDQVQAAVPMPLLHIVDVTAEAIRAAGLGRVALLGTVFTMQGEFYRGRLEKAGLQVLTPDPAGRNTVNTIIYDELCRGVVREESRAELLEIIAKLESQGAEGAILGCTELPLLVRPQHCCLPLFDTTALHARKALEYALNGVNS
ncbi:MAG: aspartate/glutamate racemase family protein [Acidobacteria bacterium]|nr:aspartate/glutamate racemase family protein [Acidobacteriota bacterium]